MGAEGTWSLAATHPDRWAMIVPICGDGDPQITVRINDIHSKVNSGSTLSRLMYGSTHGYAPNRKGFFILPANKEINNQRVFVIKESTAAVETWR